MVYIGNSSNRFPLYALSLYPLNPWHGIFPMGKEVHSWRDISIRQKLGVST